MRESDDLMWLKLGRRYRRMRVLRQIPLNAIRRQGMSIKRYKQIEAGTTHYLTELFRIARGCWG